MNHGLLRRLQRLRANAFALRSAYLLREENMFLLHEVRRLNEHVRALLLAQRTGDAEADRLQTSESFDYQWNEIAQGDSLPSDSAFMEQVQSLICEMADLPPEWFAGKRVVDVGCGVGRFTYGLLGLGARVVACDQSTWALRSTKELCAEFDDRLETREINLLDWVEHDDYDLAWSYGVVHHTGNTYLAIRNVANKVARGGRAFLMVYGFPQVYADFVELNSYEDLRQDLRLTSFDDRKRILTERFGPSRAHGWFDAVSPRINDLMSFEELASFLIDLGLVEPRRTLANRNLHVVADRPA